jgi:hypothetical protein
MKSPFKRGKQMPTINIKLYMRPHGRFRNIKVAVPDTLAKDISDNDLAISMEELGEGSVAIYVDQPAPDGISPEEKEIVHLAWESKPFIPQLEEAVQVALEFKEVQGW